MNVFLVRRLTDEGVSWFAGTTGQAPVWQTAVGVALWERAHADAVVSTLRALGEDGHFDIVAFVSTEAQA